MPWFKVDDKFHSHPKIVELSLEAIGAWALAGSWCAAHLTDGHIGFRALERLGGSAVVGDELVVAGLWHSTPTGYEFNDWAIYQPTRDEVEADRKKERERKAAYRRNRRGQYDGQSEDSQGESPGVSQWDTQGESRGVSDQPDPTRPDPTRPGTTDVVPLSGAASGTRTKGTRIPAEFYLTPAMRAYHAVKFPEVDIRLETEKFVNYFRAKSGRDATRIDWERTWQNWIITAGQRLGERSGKPTKTERAKSVLEMGRALDAGREGIAS